MGPGTVLLKEIVDRGDRVSVPADTPLREMIRRMNVSGKGAVVVVEEGKAIGILTERDVVRLLHDGTPMEERAGRIARRTLVTAGGKRTIGHALNLLVEHGIRRLVVLDDREEFLGLVTQETLFRYLEEDYYRSSLKVKHLFDRMRTLVSVGPADPVASVLRKMVDHRISAVPVLERGKPVGIITERDILRLADEGTPLGHPAAAFLSDDVVCATLDTGVVEIVRTMNAKNIGRVVVADDDGKAIGMLTYRDLARNLEGNYSDFLERKLRQAKEFLNLMPEMMVELIDTGDAQGIVWANDAVANRFGREIIDRPISELVPQNRWHEIFAVLAEHRKIDNVRFRKDDRVFECSGFYMPLDRVSEVGRIQLILRDITEEVVQATTDPLTGIYNRRYINDFLMRESERSLRTGKMFAIILMDLDHFKKVNDSHGHSAGDLVLRSVVGTAIRCTRQYDLVGRYGGEEFLIILPEIPDEQNALEIADRIRASIEASQIEIGKDRRISLTASFGVACFGPDGTRTEDLLLRVDERLYRAKKGGRNRVVGRKEPVAP